MRKMKSPCSARGPSFTKTIVKHRISNRASSTLHKKVLEIIVLTTLTGYLVVLIVFLCSFYPSYLSLKVNNLAQTGVTRL
jgi:hypothetical protein